MVDRDNPEKRKAVERARLIGKIKQGIKDFAQGTYQGSALTERECFYSDYLDTNYFYSEGENGQVKLNMVWEYVDPDEDSAEYFSQHLDYIIRGSDIVKEGFYDFRNVDGQYPVQFLPGAQRAINNVFGPNIYPSPEVSLKELRLLAKLVANPIGGLSLAQQLPSPSSWEKK